MAIGWPQGIYLVLILLSAGISLARWGEQKRDTYDIFDVAVGPGLSVALLYWGGFFG